MVPRIRSSNAGLSGSSRTFQILRSLSSNQSTAALPPSKTFVSGLQEKVLQGCTNQGTIPATQGTDDISIISLNPGFSGQWFIIYSPDGNSYGFWLNIDDNGGDPGLDVTQEFEIDCTSSSDFDFVANQIVTTINGIGEFAAIGLGSGRFFVQNSATGANNLPQYGFGIWQDNGSVAGQNAFPGVPTGSYYLLSTPLLDYYAWFNVDGAGGDPNLVGRSGIEIDISSGFNGTQMAQAVTAAFNLVIFGKAFICTDGNPSANANRWTNYEAGVATDVSNGNMPGYNVGGWFQQVTQQGTASNVRVAAGTATVTTHGYITGQKVRLTTTGTLPAPLALLTDYYLIKIDNNTLKFATSLANALGNVPITLTTPGLGTQTIQPVA